MSIVLAAALSAAAAQAEAQTSASADGATPPAKAAPSKTTPAKPAPAKAAAKKADAGQTVEEVTVTAAAPDADRTSIDRRSYGVAKDLSSTTGSISDALKNIPSVEVDVQGNVSLRGDTNVTILVDGKPSGLFRGQSAAQALQSLPADAVERVEVITNPSAEFSPDGSAGIINLVMRKTRRAGESGSVRYNMGTAGRRNGGVSGAYNSNQLTLSGDAGFRHDPQHSINVDDRSQATAPGDPVETTQQTSDYRGPLDQWNARGSVDYDITAKDRLSAELRANQTDLGLNTLEHLKGFDPNGDLNEVFDQSGFNKSVRDNSGVQVGWRRTFAYQDEVSVNASRERTFERNETEFTAVTSEPPSPDLFQDILSHNSLTLTDIRADYNRPMPDEARLKTGYDLRIDNNSYDNVGLRGISQGDATADPTQTNLFLYKQTINAAYATYERPFGNLSVLGGLRIEDVEQDLDQVTGAIVHDTNYFKAYPTLHLGYRVSDDQQLTLSYSQRIQRPNPSDLNPFRVEQDTFNFREGNPNLKPEETNSFEAGWQYHAGNTYYLATAYYRVSDHDFTDVITELGDGALLDTKENLSASKHAGVELVANGHLTEDLTYNASTNVYYAEIDSGGVAIPGVIGDLGVRSAIEGGGRFSLNWQLTPNDSAQFSSQMNARRLTPQGYVDPSFLSFLGFRHKFNDKFSAVLTVQDVFNTFRSEQIIDTALLHDRAIGSGRIQAAYLGFAWSFGAPPKISRDPAPEPEPETPHGM
ncbi:TonB-dependent receptor [Phenylobacterium sp.]|uniref:TonB-dependent receptor domain-containing protein n=1 Tax=Phenylobacterium sp. TaxID=1871053 RepID=UPI00122A2C13|nr:TonB-dependent receptor [Phenylobacterium sp.]THD60744.1 MAG: TonB-dependent receptor [Phenylobacterium sp.]